MRRVVSRGQLPPSRRDAQVIIPLMVTRINGNRRRFGTVMIVRVRHPSIGTCTPAP
jgi:hypothetical protein